MTNALEKDSEAWPVHKRDIPYMLLSGMVSGISRVSGGGFPDEVPRFFWPLYPSIFDDYHEFVFEGQTVDRRYDGWQRRRLKAFYQEIISGRNIVVEQSPPKFSSLQSLIKKSSGVTIGAFAGMMAAGDAPSLMLLTMPAGMIIGGLASGVGKALEEGLSTRLTNLILQHPPLPPPAKKRKTEGN